MALKYATSPQEALKAAKQLVAAWPHARPPDAEGYAGSLGAVLAAYPLGVVHECCDPRTGLAQKREFPPTVAAVTEWCDRRVLQHQGAIIKLRKKQEFDAQPKFTEEHERNMLKRLQDLMHGLFRQQQAQEPAE